MSATGHSELHGLQFELVAIVVSLGGAETLPVVLGGLPETFPLPILLVQHRPRGACIMTGSPRFCSAASTCPSGSQPTVNTWRAPASAPCPAAHRDDRPVKQICITESDPCSAGDTMLAGAAAVLGPAVIGVVLTGRLHDGARGVRAIKRHGGASSPKTHLPRALPACRPAQSPPGASTSCYHPTASQRH